MEDRKIGFGAHKGEPAWQEVPGEYRAMLRRLLVIQGDTEPASVEQQRHLGATAPSLYDLRNLFQVNVEEGRHLWAMVYLLQKYFGRDGREEAEELLRRRSGDRDSPRMLGAFNEATPDWLSFFMFTFFTDRDGKMQLARAGAVGVRSAVAHLPLHADRGGAPHVRRRVRGAAHRAAHLRRRCARPASTIPTDIERVRALGVIDLPTLQKKANLHFSLTLDLFGNEISTNAANAFNAGLKGRYHEDQTDRRPRADRRDLSGAAAEGRRDRARGGAGAVGAEHAAARRLRRRRQCRRRRCWNRVLERAGLRVPPASAACRVQPPHRRVRRDPRRSRRQPAVETSSGRRGAETMLPSADDDALRREPDAAGARDRALMRPWIAPPRIGIDNKPGDFEYVKIEA